MQTQDVEKLSPPSKKSKMAENEPGSNGIQGDENSGLFPFHKFKFEALCTDPLTKIMTVTGKFNADSEEYGVVVAEKLPLTEQSMRELFASSKVEKTFQNDIYSQYKLESKSGGAGEVKVITVYPATEKHLEKYGPQSKRMVLETPELYEKITKPYIRSQAMALDWVRNILDGKAEQDRVLYDDTDSEAGFVLVPDMKWDGKDLDSLYLLAIARKEGLLSLRELREEHIPLLRNILVKGKEEIRSRYGVLKDQLRAYLHYQPSFYHLHVHFTHLNYRAVKASLGETHLLEDVLDNLENIDPLYYAKRTLTFCVKESTTLWKMHSEAALCETQSR